MNPTLLLIEELGQVVAVVGPLAVTTALKIKALLELGSDFKANIQHLSESSAADNAATMVTIATWLKANGIPVPSVPPTDAPAS